MIIKKDKSEWVLIRRSILEDQTLSLAAMGLYASLECEDFPIDFSDYVPKAKEALQELVDRGIYIDTEKRSFR